MSSDTFSFVYGRTTDEIIIKTGDDILVMCIIHKVNEVVDNASNPEKLFVRKETDYLIQDGRDIPIDSILGTSPPFDMIVSYVERFRLCTRNPTLYDKSRSVLFYCDSSIEWANDILERAYLVVQPNLIDMMTMIENLNRRVKSLENILQNKTG